ncbi:DMP19 family protein [Altererythrobacter lutimaris]|uniref:DUF4375 domain-containing protein n=1 Tax=Altererythrobacter lutimaris TaxID=2743979 RepID=A0A850H9Q4_9SPHN|nr:DUF4375 domain-containing protein [Altererythrobacter lutimaris]NVE94643.1 DUF4375 domain-containing protein [Altererythrobacter lutimaris]
MPYFAAPDILKLDDDAELAWKAIEHVWDAAPYTSRELPAFLAELTQGQAALYAVDCVQKDIRNAGYRDLFFNASGNLVPAALDGFQMIDAEAYVANLSAAMSLLGDGYPPSAAARKRALAEQGEAALSRLEVLSDSFLDLLDMAATDLEKFRSSYVRANPEEFVAA